SVSILAKYTTPRDSTKEKQDAADVWKDFHTLRATRDIRRRLTAFSRDASSASSNPSGTRKVGCSSTGHWAEPLVRPRETYSKGIPKNPANPKVSISSLCDSRCRRNTSDRTSM